MDIHVHTQYIKLVYALVHKSVHTTAANAGIMKRIVALLIALRSFALCPVDLRHVH